MFRLEIPGEILADLPFIGTISDEFPNFASIVLNFLKLNFQITGHRDLGTNLCLCRLI